MSGRIRALNLYRSILRAHRTRLPAVYRALGDSYVREEFRRHKTAKPEFLKQFFAEWDLYVRTIHEQAAVTPDSIGTSLSDQMQLQLNDDQKQQLAKLKDETVKARETLIAEESR